MRKYFSFFIVIVLVFLTVLPIKTTNAAAPVLRFVAGSTAEKIMLGIGEKAGVKYAKTTARDKALKRWNYTLDDYYKRENAEIKARLEKFEDVVKTAKPQPLADKPGWSKVIISAAAFATGVDLIYEAYQAFDSAIAQERFSEMLSEDIANNNMYVDAEGFEWGTNSTAQDGSLKQFRLLHKMTAKRAVADSWIIDGTEFLYFTIEPDPTFESIRKIIAKFSGLNDKSKQVTYTASFNLSTSDLQNMIGTEIFNPTVDDLPLINTPISIPKSLTQNGLVPDLPTMPFTDIEIVIPDADWDLGQTYNDPLSDVNPNPNPNPNPGVEGDPIDRPFLEELFIPEPGFMTNLFNDLGLSIDDKFPFLTPFFEIVKIFVVPNSCRPLDNIIANLYDNDYTVVNFKELNSKASVFRPWVQGLIWIIVSAFVIRKASAIISSRGGI